MTESRRVEELKTYGYGNKQGYLLRTFTLTLDKERLVIEIMDLRVRSKKLVYLS